MGQADRRGGRGEGPLFVHVRARDGDGERPLKTAASFLAALLAVPAIAAPGWTSRQEPATAQAAAPASFPYTDAERERFLLEGEVIAHRAAPGGITASTRATMKLGGFTHDAHIQTIDEKAGYRELRGKSEIDFRDSYKNNVAAYRLDRMLGLGMIPVTVLHPFNHQPASYTWWLDDILMDEKTRNEQRQPSPDPDFWNRQMLAVRVFDQLIYNFDRHLGNILIDKEWRIWMIDHSRAFKIFKELQRAQNLEARCSRSLLEAIRKLDEATLKKTMEGLLTSDQIRGLLARRDTIVRHYDGMVATRGEEAVLYDLPTRVLGPAAAR